MLNLDAGLSQMVTRKKPSNAAFIKYLFLTFGVSEKEFEELTMPYIFEMLDTHNYIKREEEKAMKKARRKK